MYLSHSCGACVSALGAEPSFRVPAVNVTVVAGGLAVLPCPIIHLTEGHTVRTRLIRPRHS